MGEQQGMPAGRGGKRFPILSSLTCATFTFAGVLMAGEPATRSETVVWVPTRMLARHVVRTSSRDILRESRYAVGPMPGLPLGDAVAARVDEPSMQRPDAHAPLAAASTSREPIQTDTENHDEDLRLAWIERISQASALPDSFVQNMMRVDPGDTADESADALTDEALVHSARMLARTAEQDAQRRELLAAAVAGERLSRARPAAADTTRGSEDAPEVPEASSSTPSGEGTIQHARIEPDRTIRMPMAVPEGRVLCFGDCVTLGEWWEEDIGRGTRWVDLLGDRSPRLHTINAGRDGLETRHGWYLREMLRTHPHVDTVILSLGVNDLRGTNRVDGARISRARSNMAAMIDEVRAAKPDANILLASPVGIAPDHLSRRWQEEQFGLHTVRMLEMMAASYEALAREKGVEFVNLTDAIPAAHLPDGVHPDQTGHAMIARIFYEALGGEPEADIPQRTALPVARWESPASDDNLHAAQDATPAQDASTHAVPEDLRAMAAPASGVVQRSEVILPPVASAEELTVAAMDADFVEEMLLELQGHAVDPLEDEQELPSPERLNMDALRYAETEELLRTPDEIAPPVEADPMPVRPDAARTRQNDSRVPHSGIHAPVEGMPQRRDGTTPAVGNTRGADGSIEDFLSGLRDHEMPELEPTRLPRGTDRPHPTIPGIPDATMQETPRRR